MNDFDWALVPSFLAALEHGSLLGAARALGASQPTLGRHIAELESQLGVVLFERTGRGLRPTETALRLALPQVQVELVASNEVSNLLRREADIALRMVQPQQASLIARRLGKVT